MIKDVYSRKLVANEVHESESAEQAAQLLRQASLREQKAGQPLVLRWDNGSAMKGSTMLAAMQNLGVMPSFSRLRVSNDNAYAEALFRTAKYCPLWPERPVDTLEQARNWVNRSVALYNHRANHKHTIRDEVVKKCWCRTAERHADHDKPWPRNERGYGKNVKRRFAAVTETRLPSRHTPLRRNGRWHWRPEYRNKSRSAVALP